MRLFELLLTATRPLKPIAHGSHISGAYMTTAFGRFLFRMALLAASFLSMASCGPPTAPMTANEIATRGTRSFESSRERVFAATVGALKTLGYEIAVSDAGAGIVKTAPKNLGAIATGGLGYAALTVYAHAYAVRVSESNGLTVIEATPRIFQNSIDVSTGPWVLEGPGGQYSEWDKLFQEVASNLGTSPPAPGGGGTHADQ